VGSTWLLDSSSSLLDLISSLLDLVLLPYWSCWLLDSSFSLLDSISSLLDLVSSSSLHSLLVSFSSLHCSWAPAYSKLR